MTDPHPHHSTASETPHGPLGADAPHGSFGAAVSDGSFGVDAPHGSFGVAFSRGSVGVDAPHRSFGAVVSDGSFGAEAPRGSFGAAVSDGSFGAEAPRGSFGAVVSDRSVGADAPLGLVRAAVRHGLFRAAVSCGLFRATAPRRPGSGAAALRRGAGVPVAARRLVRMLAALVTVAGLLAITGGPAAAHAGGLTATDARGRVVTVVPAVPGLEITAIEDGARLRLRNGTPGPVTVTAGGGPATPAVIPSGGELTWIDERSTPDGRTVAAGETVAWTIPLDVAGTTVVVTGALIGEQRPAAPLWWLAAVLTTAVIIVLSRRTRRSDLLLATAGTLAAATSIAHVIGSTLAVESAPPAGTFLSAAGINLLAWPLIIGGAVTAFRGRAAGVLAVCGGAALTAVFVLPDVTSFHRAVLPFEGPAVIERILVVLALGLGAGVAVAGAGVLRDLAQKAATSDAPAAGEPAGGTVLGDGETVSQEQRPTAGEA